MIVFHDKFAYSTVYNRKRSVKVQYGFVLVCVVETVDSRQSRQILFHEKFATTDLQRITRREERSCGKCLC